MGNRNGSMGYNSPSHLQRPSSASSFRSSSGLSRGRSSSSFGHDAYPVSTLNKLNSMEDSPLINKLRQKVASRVMGYNKGASDQLVMPSSSSLSTSSSSSSSRNHSHNQHTGRGGESNDHVQLKSQSSLTNDQLTAHLTDEERMILQKVFQKEEEFHRESLLRR